ncbi:hypothetical protein [Carboxylicivirga linearis]|uniref:Chaperone protein DnaJ n=1 Tax=Carboxylicivirga linearis TaxID=1628157 RepID=A0ABS5K139_9BACT|nr:hypothetical protein [Carboxylicivirga linearis]MBS2100411.1 hypothetical protein [Carboxylicivirga linearis]
MSRIELIITCPKCEGRGLLKATYYKSSKDAKIIDCPHCSGQGRLIQVTTITTEPLNQSPASLNTICLDD